MNLAMFEEFGTRFTYATIGCFWHSEPCRVLQFHPITDFKSYTNRKFCVFHSYPISLLYLIVTINVATWYYWSNIGL